MTMQRSVTTHCARSTMRSSPQVWVASMRDQAGKTTAGRKGTMAESQPAAGTATGRKVRQDAGESIEQGNSACGNSPRDCRVGKNGWAEIFADKKTEEKDVYASVKKEARPLQGKLYRKACMLEVMRVLAGFESSWKWDTGRDKTES